VQRKVDSAHAEHIDRTIEFLYHRYRFLDVAIGTQALDYDVLTEEISFNRLVSG
jgi:hypothetical protein